PSQPARSAPHGSTLIHDYAVIGDMKTCALVSRGGSVDWLCLPRFDSPSSFTALLGTPQHGRWLIGPVEEARSTRRYVGDTFVLETTHETDTGVVKVTDVMPTADDRADIVRTVEGVKGTVRMRHEWVVRFSYGKITPWVSRHDGPGGADDKVISAVAGPDALVLRGTRLPHAHDGKHVDEFDVAEGDRLVFSTTWAPSHLPIREQLDSEAIVETTREEWQEWADRFQYEGPYRDVLVRSLLVLRLLTHSETGGIVAAPTTSLPEDVGGTRNWDYRYCWLRDASLTLEALMGSGFVEETLLWRRWLLRAVAGDPEDMQIMYAVDGSRDLPEREIGHLPGYAGSRPVRIGNAAVSQRQTDVLGEVMMALSDGRDHGLEESDRSWRIQRSLVEELGRRWDEPDNGLWEIRGPLRYFTHSRVMVWAAFDRAIQGVEKHGLSGPVDKWRDLRDQVREEILAKGFNTERNTFTQHYETDEVDASLLLIPICGFLPPDDPKVLGTLDAIVQDLMHEGLLLRYRTTSGVDGLPGSEHPFLACSFWLVQALALAGRPDQAKELMDRLVALVNDVGLLSEEYDPKDHRMVGNYPQAFSHLTLIGAAHALAGVATVKA
ncbi:glycoside hydrolase family 15 protein, partial [Lapillicoccus sp.]|uniref:glycoside hydrolase family 15 protein n=1 Tax=Lapillicoccus sp. TaxID=1909287 RepID=UPI0039C9701F